MLLVAQPFSISHQSWKLSSQGNTKVQSRADANSRASSKSVKGALNLAGAYTRETSTINLAVEVLFGSRYLELVHEDRELLAGSYELPDAALADVPDELRK